MLIGLVIGLLFVGGGGGGGEITMAATVAEVHKKLPGIVEDADRLEAAQALLDEMDARIKSDNEQFEALIDELLTVDSKYESTPQDYEQVNQDFKAFFHESFTRRIDYRFAMKETLTREDWIRLYRALKAP